MWQNLIILNIKIYVVRFGDDFVGIFTKDKKDKKHETKENLTMPSYLKASTIKIQVIENNKK